MGLSKPSQVYYSFCWAAFSGFQPETPLLSLHWILLKTVTQAAIFCCYLFERKQISNQPSISLSNTGYLFSLDTVKSCTILMNGIYHLQLLLAQTIIIIIVFCFPQVNSIIIGMLDTISS